VTVGDTINAVIRNSFFGDEYDGLQITGYPLDAASRARSTSQREAQRRPRAEGE
jgi:hypothetical protein